MSKKHKHASKQTRQQSKSAQDTTGLTIAFEAFCDYAEQYKRLASMYQDWATHVTKQQIKDSGSPRSKLAKHYRYLAECARFKVLQFEHKANRILSQLG